MVAFCTYVWDNLKLCPPLSSREHIISGIFDIIFKAFALNVFGMIFLPADVNDDVRFDFKILVSSLIFKHFKRLKR